MECKRWNKGKISTEWYDIKGKPMRYCLGWIDMMTEEPELVCKLCVHHVSRADDDRKAYYHALKMD